MGKGRVCELTEKLAARDNVSFDGNTIILSTRDHVILMFSDSLILSSLRKTKV